MLSKLGSKSSLISSFLSPSNIVLTPGFSLHHHRGLWLALCCAVAFTLISGIVPAQAEGFTFTPEIKLPGVFDKDDIPVDSSLMSQYIRAIFVYFIWVVGTVATFMIIYGGIRWVAAAGNSGQIKEARSIIDNAVIGIIIALTSVVLLNIINPKLTQLSIPNVETVTKKYVQGLNVASVCEQKLDVDCGYIRDITPTAGKEKVYCIGTKCPESKTSPTGANVCVIDQVAGKLAPHPSGCVAAVSVATTEAKLDNRATIPATRGDAICSDVVRFATDIDVGTKCSGGNRFCYQLGPKATYDAASDRMSNLCCPGQVCPKQ